MSIEFYLGLAAAVPLGILTWFIQRKIEPYLNSRNARAVKGKREKLEQTLVSVGKVKDTDTLNIFILHTLLFIALIGAFGAILSTTIQALTSGYMLAQQLSVLRGGINDQIVAWGSALVQILIALVIAAYTFAKAREGFLMYQRVTNYDDFKVDTETKIQKLIEFQNQ